jgi:SP family xylose:H+ symportor-like MFS transporter
MMNDNGWLTQQFHHGFSYWIYGLMSILSAVFIWKFVPETKGKTLEQMGGMWRKEVAVVSSVPASEVDA